METPHEHTNHAHVHETKPMNYRNDNRMALAVLAYIGPLVIVSYLAGREDPFVKFHIKQGLVLLVIELILWFLSGGLFYVWIFVKLFQLLNLATFILAIVGIVNAATGKETPLPIVGGFADEFKIS